jgi:protein subunit release factor A
MTDHLARTIATMRESIRSLQRMLETEQRIASGSNAELAEAARTEIPRIEARIAEAEARVRELEALRPA